MYQYICIPFAYLRGIPCAFCEVCTFYIRAILRASKDGQCILMCRTMPFHLKGSVNTESEEVGKGDEQEKNQMGKRLEDHLTGSALLILYLTQCLKLHADISMRQSPDTAKGLHLSPSLSLVLICNSFTDTFEGGFTQFIL